MFLSVLTVLVIRGRTRRWSGRVRDRRWCEEEVDVIEYE